MTNLQYVRVILTFSFNIHNRKIYSLLWFYSVEDGEKLNLSSRINRRKRRTEYIDKGSHYNLKNADSLRFEFRRRVYLVLWASCAFYWAAGLSIDAFDWITYSMSFYRCYIAERPAMLRFRWLLCNGARLTFCFEKGTNPPLCQFSSLV